MLAGIFFLAIGTAFHLAGLVCGRWLAGFPFGARKMGDAWRPTDDATRGMSIARAFGGVAGFYLACATLITISLLAGGEHRVDEASMRVEVAQGGPAARAGIERGDRIVSVEGEPIADWAALRKAIGAHSEEPIRVEIERAGARRVVQPVPIGIPGKIQVGPLAVVETPAIGHAIARGLSEPAWVVMAAAKSIFGDDSPAELAGPVGIVRQTGAAKKDGSSVAIHFVALLGAYFMPILAIASAIVAATWRRRTKALPTADKSS